MTPHFPYRTFSKALGLVWGVCVLGCTGPAEVPEIAPLDDLSAEYDAPTAELEQAEVRDALGSTSDLDGLAAGFRSTQSVVDDATEDVTEPVEERSGDGVELQGSIRATLRCPGDLGVPEYDEAVNGSLSLVLAVDANRIRRGMLGEAKGCVLAGRLLDLPVAVRLDGVLAIDIGADIVFGRRWTSNRFLVAVQGTLEVGDYSFDGVFVRITATTVEHLIRLQNGGTVVVSIGDSSITVRDRDVTWSCDRGSGPCSML